MRKDIFIVGARLLGIWQLLASLTPLVSVIGFWGKSFSAQAYNQEYYILLFIVHLLTGQFLIFKAHSLYRLLDRLTPEEEDVKDDETK